MGGKKEGGHIKHNFYWVCIWQSVLLINPKDNGSISGMLIFFMCYSNMFPLLFNDCYNGTELERAAQSFFGFHVLIWKWNCLWAASLVSFEFWMYLCIQILSPEAAMKKLRYLEHSQCEMVGSIIAYTLKCTPFNAWT